MKRFMMVAVPIALLAMVGTYGVVAQQSSQTPPQPGSMMGQGGMMRGGMMGPGMMQRGGMMGQQPCPACGMMAGAMMWRTMTATPDGGVIIAVGNRLIKYDSQLNVVKDTEMKIDTNQMLANVQKMIENCPLCRQAQQQAQAQTQTPGQPQARE